MYPVGLGFAPSVASAQAAGVKVTKAPYPDGPEGIALSLDTVAHKVREGRLDPRVRKRAIDVLRAAGIDGRDRPSVKRQVQALLDDLRATTIYIADPVDSEHVTGAATLLCLSPTECVQGEDCESLCVALGSECMSIGIPVQLVKQTFAQGGQEHLIIKVQDEYGAWLPADPSDKSMPVGQSHAASHEVAVDPMNPSATTYGMKTGAGAVGPEIVTLGALGGCCGSEEPEPRSRLAGYPEGLGGVVETRWDPASGSYVGIGAASVSQLNPCDQFVIVVGPSGGASGALAPLPPTFLVADVSTDASGNATFTGTYNGLLPFPLPAAFVDTNVPAGVPPASYPIVSATVTGQDAGCMATIGASPATGPYAQAQTALNSMLTTVAAGDAYQAASPPDYASAVKSYQAAGLAGATVVGPAIDLAGAPNVTQPATQAAWQLNGALAAMTGTGASDAQVAKQIVGNMVSLYQQAIAAGTAALGGQTPTTTSGAGGPGGISTSTVVLGALGAGVLAGLAFFAYKRSQAAHENPIWRSKGGQFSYPGGARGRRMHRSGKCPHCQRGARECACRGR